MPHYDGYGAAVPNFNFDRFPRFEELTTLLHEYTVEYPALVRIDSIGKSFEGRDIWLMTVTNSASRPASEKPAVWIDANIHATEVTGGVAAIHLIHHLVNGYGTDAEVTAALDTRAFYIVPRLNPDGVEVALSDRPRFVRSSVRRYPVVDAEDGLVEGDADGDGRFLFMRVADANGAWTPAAQDPRLLVPVDPTGVGVTGIRYRLLPEGKMRNYDGVTVPIAAVAEGLDLNRQYPAGWRPESDQLGAGPYTLSEPETRAEVQAIAERPNVTAFVAYHTSGGVHLRPYSEKPDDDMPSGDLRTYRFMGAKATEFTGYKSISVFHDFKYDFKVTEGGASDDWAYDHLGIYGWTTEFWSMLDRAGIVDFHQIEWYNSHPISDDLKLMAWADRVAPGEIFVDWYPFDHPQLGPVELGGWDFMKVSNALPSEMLAEVEPHSKWAVWLCLISPRLELVSAVAEPVGDGVWRVRVVVHNTGFLPTNVTQRAVQRKAVGPVVAVLSLADGCVLLTGKGRQELGQLTGRERKNSMMGWSTTDPTSDRGVAEWVVSGVAGQTLAYEVRHPRAGVARGSIALP